MLTRDAAALVVVDVQEAFRGYDVFAGVAAASAKLVEAARVLGVPTVVTEQYPEGLGHAVAELGLAPGARVVEKSVFSAARADGFSLDGRPQAILCGIEAHVCVAQTALDLLEQEVEVYLPADAVGSRFPLDCEIAVRRLERAGAVVTTVEAVLFELLERAGTPEFKAIQGLVR